MERRTDRAAGQRNCRIQIRLAIGVLFALLSGIVSAQQHLTANWLFSSVGACESVAYSPDGTFLAVGGYGGIHVYSVSSGVVRAFATHAYEVKSVVFSPDGATLAVGGTDGAFGTLELWNVATGMLSASLPTAATKVYTCAFSRDGKDLGVGGSQATQGTLELWSMATRTMAFSLSTTLTTVQSLTFTPDSKVLADGGAIGQAGTVEFWNVATGKPEASFPRMSYPIASIAISPDGTQLVSGGASQICLWDLVTGAFKSTINTSAQSITSVAFSPDGQTVADTGNSSYPTNHYNLWYGLVETSNLSNGVGVSTGYRSSPEQLSIAFSPDGTHLATGGTVSENFPVLGFSSGSLTVWTSPGLSMTADLVTGGGGGYYPTSFPPPVFSPDGRSIIGGGTTGTAGLSSVWRTVDGAWLSEFGSTGATACAYAKDGRTIAIATGSTLQLYDAATMTMALSIPTNWGWITWISLSPDGTKIAAAGGQNNLAGIAGIWSTSTGQLLNILDPVGGSMVSAVVFSPNGALVATCGQLGPVYTSTGVIQLWDSDRGNLISTLPTAEGSTMAIAFSPDGKALAAAGLLYNSFTFLSAGVLELWNVPSKKRIAALQLPPYTSAVTSVVFTPNGKTVLAATNSSIATYNAMNGAFLGYFSNGADFLAVSPDGSLLAYETYDDELDVCSLPAVVSFPISGFAVYPTAVQAGDSPTATVTISSPAPKSGAKIDIYSDFGNGGFLMPVTIPAGSRSVSFAVPTNSYEIQSTLNLTASSGPYSKSAALTVLPLPPAIQSVTMNPASVVGGQLTYGLITLASPVLPNDLSIATSADNRAVNLAPASMIFQGQTTTNLLVWTDPVSDTTPVTITAKLGTSTQSAILTLTPAPVSQVAVNPSTIRGGSSAKGTVTLSSKAGPKGNIVFLKSSSPAVSVPSKVTVPAGTTRGTFALKSVNVSAQTSVTITATTGSTSVSVSVTVNPK
ncbi:MAG: WD40 repeat domain-containing protein [Fimbriimonas sp.]|nr:WD40 repeat domain-containing protein [Fimbriimonas sp.]